MIKELRITVLAENTVGAPKLMGEHGLALWIEAGNCNILFDTGQGMVLEHNAEQLGVELEAADAIVLSHGHFDHTGGLSPALDRFRKAVVYVHPSAFQEKFHGGDDGRKRYIGSPIRDADRIRSHVANVVFTDEPTELTAGVWVTGQIPRRTSFEDTGGPFYLDRACEIPDPLHDDQALYVQSKKGIVVVLGCAHAGVVNTLDYIAEQTGNDRIYAVLGGMHLIRASEERIEQSLNALRRYGVQRIGPAHCTGLQAVARMLAAYPEQFVKLATGLRLTIS